MGNSPFSGPTPAVEATAPGGLEFRGVVGEGSEVWVNLYDPATKRSYWNVVPGASAAGLQLETYDPISERLTVVQAGRRLDLALRRGRVLLPPDLRPLVVPDVIDTRGDDSREAFVRQLPPEARAMLESVKRRRHTATSSAPANEPEFTNR